MRRGASSLMPGWLWQSGARDLFVSDYARCLQLQPHPRGISVSAAGEVFVADRDNGRVVAGMRTCTTAVEPLACRP